jgi:small-conductance mechanosensitive channel
MKKSKDFTSIIHEHKTLFIIIAVVLFLLELQIFAVATMKSGRKSLMQILDESGNVIHETDGRNLSDFNKYYFEKTFGPLDQYKVRLETKEYPFPFRAWFVAAVGVPVGIVLLFSFVVKAYISLFYGNDKNPDAVSSHAEADETKLETILSRIGRFNIFTIGFLIFLAVFAYWVIPNLITFLGKTGLETLSQYKLFFISASLIFLGLVVWVIYLRYRLAVKSIESRTEIEKQRIQLEIAERISTPAQIEYRQKDESNEQ